MGQRGTAGKYRPILGARFVALVRALVIALALPLASAGALPVWAQLAGVEGPHVCHCSTEKHDCVCPRCNTDPDAAMFLSSESLKGKCGDDDVAFGGKAFLAILRPLPIVPVAGPTEVRLSILPPAEDSRGRSPPPTPPPRAS